MADHDYLTTYINSSDPPTTDGEIPFAHSPVHYLSDGPRLHVQPTRTDSSDWVAGLLNEFGLEEPLTPPHSQPPVVSSDVPDQYDWPEESSIANDQDESGCIPQPRYVDLPSERFLQPRLPQLRPSCCVNKKTGLSLLRLSKQKKRIWFDVGDAFYGQNLSCKVRRRKRSKHEILEGSKGVELFEVVGFSDPEDDRTLGEGENVSAAPVETGRDEPVWLSRTSLKFKPCRPYEEDRQCFYLVNQTAKPVGYTFAVMGDPRLHNADKRVDGSEIAKVPSHTEMLQEKPFFRHANMKFDPIAYSIGPIVGSEQLPFTDSWFQSYRHTRQKDNYAGTSVIPVSSGAFIVGTTPIQTPSDMGKFQEAVAQFFTVEPWSGTLAPLESIMVCVRFQPWFVTTAHAQLACTTSLSQQHVKSVYLLGPCARINVEICPKCIDLGTCLYDVMIERIIQLTNHGRYIAFFSFDRVEKLTRDTLTHPRCDVVYASVVCGKVRPNEDLNVKVYFVPGRPGKFVKHVYVCVEGESAVRVDIRGRAAYQSIELDLPQKLPNKVKCCRAARKDQQRSAYKPPHICKDFIERNGQVKLAPDVQDAIIDHWAQLSQNKAKQSNIRRNPVFTSAVEYRPFEGILDFVKLPDYLLDFYLHGPASSHVDRLVHVLNSGTQPISFRLTQTNNNPLRDKISVHFNRHNLVKPGRTETIHFSIDPHDYILGRSECPVLFTVTNGPTFTITCRITIEEPRLDIHLRCTRTGELLTQTLPEIFGCKMLPHPAATGDSPSVVLRVPVIDFGTVRCGLLSTMYVQLVNPGKVPCTWRAENVDVDSTKQGRLLPPKERLQLKTYRESHRSFRLWPLACTLQPGQRLNLEILFHPVDDLEYRFAWPISVQYSQCRLLLHAKGRGVRPRLEFSTMKIAFDFILPYMGGQEKTLIVYNPCPFPVEFYVKELDKQHIYEDEMISHVEEFDRDIEVRFPVRRVGATIPEPIIEFYKNHFAVGSPLAPAPPSVVSMMGEYEQRMGSGSPTFGGRPETPVSQPSSPIDMFPINSNLLEEDELPDHLKSRFPKMTANSQFKKNFTSKREMYKALREIVQTPLAKSIAASRGLNVTLDIRKEQFKKGAVFIIHGSPSCGKTTLSTALGRHYKIPILSIDKIVMDAIQRPTERIHHRVLSYILSPTSLGLLPSYGAGTARSLQTPPDQDGKGRDKSKVPSLKLIAKLVKPSAHIRAPAGAQNNVSVQRDQLDPDLAFQSKKLIYHNYLTDEQAELTTCVIPEDMLSELVSARLYKQDCRRGAVFDGMRSDFLESFPSAARTILTALENRKRIYSFVLCNTFRDYRKRRQRQRMRRKDGTYAKIIRQMAELRKLSEVEYRAMRRTVRKKVDSTISDYVAAMRLMGRRIKQPIVKTEPVLQVEHHGKDTIQASNKVKGALSSQRLPAAREDLDGDSLSKKPSYRSDLYGSNETISLSTGMKSLARTVSARVGSLVKIKGKPASNGKDGKVEKAGRDSWEMTPRIRKDSSVCVIYRTDLYRQHKFFYSTLKDYTTVMTKWSGSAKQEPKRAQRSEALKDQMPAAAKKRTAKSKDAKSKPKEVSDTERATRDKAAIEKMKVRCRKRKLFGVKHSFVMRRLTKINDSRLINFKTNTGRWINLPNYSLIEEATKTRLPIPKPEVFAMRKKPPILPLIEEDQVEPHFRFVVGLDEPVPAATIPTPLLAAHLSTHVIPVTAEYTASTKEATEKSNRLDAKLDRTKTAKSAVKLRNIGSAMPRDAAHSLVKEEKMATPLDFSLVYPSFNQAKAQSEAKSKPISFFRWALPAYCETTIKLLFQSNEEGSFHQDYTFQIVDYSDAGWTVSVRGTCQYTNLFANLAKIFPPAMWVEQIVNDRLAPVYVEGDKKLFFGPLLAGKKKVDILADKAPQNIYTFTVKNHYKQALNVHFNTVKHSGLNPKDKTPASDFSVVPDRFVIRSKDEQVIKFYAHPMASGRCDDTILAFTEFNPVPTQFNLTALSVKPQVEVLTKNVMIEKVPIREISSGNIEVRNKSSLIPIRWKLIGIDQLPPEFVFEAREGTLKATSDVQMIPVKFISTSEKAVVHMKKPLRIEFSSEDPDLGTTQTENFTISGESYDLVLDITFPKVLDSVLDFGICKVNDEVVRQITIRNKSKSDCGFQLVAIYDDLPAATQQRYSAGKLKSLLDFQPASGTLTSADRPVTINVVCNPTFEIEMKLEKIVRCLVQDPARANICVAEIPIKTNICAKYSKFVLQPPIGEVRFPCTLPLQKRSRTVTLQNIGDYEFVYAIKKIASNSQPAAHQPNSTLQPNKKEGAGTHSSANALVQKTSVASTHISSRKADTANVNPGVAGIPFVIRPLTGVVKVGDTAQILIEFGSDIIGTHEETHSVEVTDRDPAKYLNGIIYTFSGETAVPIVDTKNIEQIFSEHVLAPTEMPITNRNLEKLLLDRSVYVSKRRQFYVQHTFVGTIRRLRFRLSNPTNIQCPIVVSVKPPVAAAAKTQVKSTAEGFSIIGGAAAVIEPHQFVYVVLVFAPLLAIKYQATFELAIETPGLPNSRTPGLNFEILAEAILPSLRILPPVQKDKRGQHCLYYQKTAVGRQQILPVRIYNDTVMPVSAVLRLRNTENVFEMIPDGGDDQRAKREMTFSPKEERTINVKFAPASACRFRKYFEISCMENISPDIFILLKAESVAEQVELDGLPPVTYEDRLRLITATGNQVEDVAMERYQLYFGDCRPSQTLTARFEILNPTANWLRFEWVKLPDTIDMSPRVGHVKPQSFVPVQAKYNILEEMQTRIVPVQCNLSTIAIQETYDIEHVWNSERQSLQILADLKKTRPDSDSPLTVHSTDKLDTDRDSDNSVKDDVSGGEGSKHDKKDTKKTVDAKKSKEKKSAVSKKESPSEMHRKMTDKVVDKGGKRRPSELKRDVTGKTEGHKKAGLQTSLHKEPLGVRQQSGDTNVMTAESSRIFVSPGGTKTELTMVDDLGVQQKIMAPTPEPTVTVKAGTLRSLTLVVSSIVGFAKFECSHLEVLFKDTHILERRRITFTVKNTGTIAIRYITAFSTSPESCSTYLQQVAAINATQIVSAQEKERPEKGGKKGRVEVAVDEDASPILSLPPPRTEKVSKHATSPRASAASSNADAPAGKESQRRKRKVSKDNPSDMQIVQQQQVALSPRLVGGQSKGITPLPISLINVRRIDANRFKSFTSLQTSDLTTAFEVSPAAGTIDPLTSQIFTLEFHPGDQLEYIGCLFFQLDNQDPHGLPLAIPIYGLAKLPLLHLNTAPESNLRWNEVPGQEGHILDFKCIGIDESVTQQLILTNPTTLDYDFLLTCLDHEDSKKPPFELSRTSGLVAAGKRTSMDVTFTPYCLGTMESKWMVQIPAYGVVFPMSFNAVVRNPVVSLTPSVIAFRPLLPRMKKTRTLILTNMENDDLKFQMDMENFKGFDKITWDVFPPAGIVKAKAKLEIFVTVTPMKEFSGELLLLCKVQKCSQPLHVIVEHDIMAPLVEVLYLNNNDRITLQDDTQQDSTNIIDFGHTDACCMYKKNFQLTNTGTINISYRAKLVTSMVKQLTYQDVNKAYLQISNRNGIISPGKIMMLGLSYSPQSLHDKLTNLKVLIEVEFGPRYVLILNGDLCNIDIDFSFDECDFGPVLILRDSPEVGTTVPLIIANRTRRRVTLDMLNYVLPSSMAFEFAPLTLEPGNSTIHTVMFLPSDIGHCSGSLTFLMNEGITKAVKLKGEGVEMHLEVPARMRHLQFSMSSIGKRNATTMEIWNRSKVEITGRVVLQSKTNGTQLKQLIDDKILYITPNTDISIPTQKSLKSTINFKPVARTLNFDARICFITDQQVVRDLSTLTGNCDGLDVVLQDKTIDFGAVVLHGSLRRTVVMENLGELGAYYCWDTTHAAPHFTIKPRKGYVPVKGRLVFEIVFAPKSLDGDIRVCDIECEMAGNRTLIRLTLLGSCVALPLAKETVVFECPVRYTDVKPLSITNTTSTVWQLKPVVSNGRWSLPAVVTVKPNATEIFEAVFKPLDGGPHQATVSFVLPTGQATVFNLFGKTQPPRPNGKVVRDIPCRTEHRETLTLFNWLPRMQIFKVIYEYVKPDKADPCVELTGRSVVHIPALAQLNYEFIFKALRDKDVNIVYLYRVLFKNEETEEYQYYDVQYKVIKGPLFGSKTITTQIRTLRRETVRILNPLDTHVSIMCTLQGAMTEVTLEPTAPMAIGGKKEAEIFLDFFPLKSGFAQGRVDVASPELGAFFIEVNLIATAAAHQTPIHFECALGSTTTQTCRVLNYSRAKADFVAKVIEGASEFQLLSERSTYSVPPGTVASPSEQTIEVQFDPSQLGEFCGRVVATSMAAGEFHFIFVGTCVRSKPKGPYTILPTGESVPALEFRNPFLRSCSFNLVSSNCVFQVKDVTDVIKAKKTVSLLVTFSPNSTDSGMLRGVTVLGQITVTPRFDGPVTEDETAEWIYYVKAES